MAATNDQQVILSFLVHSYDKRNRKLNDCHFIDAKASVNGHLRPTDSGVTVAEQAAVDAADDCMYNVDKTSGTDVRLQQTHTVTVKAKVSTTKAQFLKFLLEFVLEAFTTVNNVIILMEGKNEGSSF